MKRAIEVVRAGRWPASERTDTVTLLFDDRYRRRLRMLGDDGLDFLLDLVEPVVLHTGDGLKLEEGGFVEVKAADEDLVEVRGRDAAAFARLPGISATATCRRRSTATGSSFATITSSSTC